MMRPPIIAGFVFCLIAHSALAQMATMSGSVYGDSQHHVLAGAQIAIPQLGKDAKSDGDGAYRLTGLLAGQYVVIVRAVGYAPIQDTVVLVSEMRVVRDYVLAQRVPVLDSVVTKSTAPNMREWWRDDFEWRRKAGVGHFVTEEQLRNRETESLAFILSTIPGVALEGRRSQYFLRSSRGGQVGGALTGRPCYAAVYLDGARIYTPGSSIDPPDMSRLWARELAAVEYYAGPAQTPLKYASISPCGLLLLYSRTR
jgi:hypothetical protein